MPIDEVLMYQNLFDLVTFFWKHVPGLVHKVCGGDHLYTTWASDTHSLHEVLMGRVSQIYNLIIWPPPGTGPDNVFCVLAPFYNVKQ